MGIAPHYAELMQRQLALMPKAEAEAHASRHAFQAGVGLAVGLVDDGFPLLRPLHGVALEVPGLRNLIEAALVGQVDDL